MQIKNPLYIGNEYLNLEGRAVKHVGVINHYAPITTHKISKTRMQFVSFDLETLATTAELRLMGRYDGTNYDYTTEEFLMRLFNTVLYCSDMENPKSIIYWSRLDPSVLYKQILLMLKEKEQKESLIRYQRVDGAFNKKTETWDIEPLGKCSVLDGKYEFGVLKSIRSCLLFYYINWDDEHPEPKTVWAYDILPFYMVNLETIAKVYLPWYSKIDKTAHIVNWDNFNAYEKGKNEEHKDYHDMVIKSNYFDCKACYDLANILQDDFYDIFNWYPTTLISPGSLTRACYQAIITNNYEYIENERDRKARIMDDLKSISIVNYYDDWKKQLGDKDFKDFLSLKSECYKGARIECFANGYTPVAYTADITSAYVAEIVKLWDLRNSKVIKGTGEPHNIPNAYILIRGDIHTGEHPAMQYHTVLIKHPVIKNLNITALGDCRASYFFDEREEMRKLGATFENEEWYAIITEGKLSVLAQIELKLFGIRKGQLIAKIPKEKLTKTIMVSGYGVSYEAIMTYIMEHGIITASGFRAGEFYNDLYASQITKGTRLMNFQACIEILKNGGKPVGIMTDSISWIGKITDMPSRFWKEEKTLGYYEKPEEVRDYVSLGSGRYEYCKYNKKTGEWDKYVAKTRGLNVTDFTDENGVVLTQFHWLKLLNKIQDKNASSLHLRVKLLITPGVVAHSNTWKVKDMGLVATDDRDIDVIVGKQKRRVGNIDYTRLKDTLYWSEPLYVMEGMDGEPGLPDHTLPVFRKLVGEMTYTTKEERMKSKNVKASKKYYEKNKDEAKEKYNSKYTMLRKRGLSVEESKRMAGWKTNKIYEWLKVH